MARTFEYAVLTATPDPRRGERVNIGLAVFCDDRIDVRLKDAAFKLKALTGESWERPLDAMRARFECAHENGMSAKAIWSSLASRECVFQPSNLSWFRADFMDQYDAAIEQIMQALVFLPRRERPERQSRINTEISAHLRRVKLLAKPGETINDGKVVKNFPIAEEEGLVADFALKNGRLCFAATLDLRRQTTNLGHAALKAITLDKSHDIYGEHVKRIGVYATDRSTKETFGRHIKLLADYADEIFEWTDPRGQEGLKKALYNALAGPFTNN